VTINIELLSREHYIDAFKNPDVQLFIPVDRAGKMVSHLQAVHFQCWAPGGRNEQIPEVAGISVEKVKICWLKKTTDGQFRSLQRSTAYNSIKTMSEWLLTLHRDPSGDIKNIGNIILS
jgi:hypothetical protein